MQRLGLTAAELKAYNRNLGRTHWRRVTLETLNLSGGKARPLLAPMLSGQIDVDVSTTPSQVLSLELYDPKRKLGLDPSIAEYPAYRSRMVQVTDWRFVEELAKWVPAVVFTGPVFDVDREGPVVKVTAHDKSVLAMNEAWLNREFPEGTRHDRVLREVLRDAGESENRMSVSKTKATLGSKFAVKKMDKRWPKARKLAKASGRELFYTGPGVAMCRRPPSRSQWTVPRTMVLSTVRLDRATEAPKNTFQLVGGKPEGKNAKRVVSRAFVLPPSHPDNPRPGSGIGRNGKLRRIPLVETNDKIKSKRVADSIARGMRNDVARQAVDVQVDIAPAPHLEPYDLISVPTPDGTFLVRLHKYVLPLGPEGSPAMGLGYTKRVGAPTGAGRNDGKGGRSKSGRGKGKGRRYRIHDVRRG